MVKLVIHKNEAEQRLDKFLLKYLDKAGTSFLYKMLRKKNITLNGKRAEGSERLKENDEVTLFLSDETVAIFRSEGKASEAQAAVKPTGIRLDIVYEDEDVLLINKPAGLLSQKAAAEDVSVNDAVVEHVRNLQAAERSERGAAGSAKPEGTASPLDDRAEAFTPSICNRLDRNTSGLITAGKTLAGLQFLSEQFRSRRVDKYYLALVSGVMEKALQVKGWLLKDEASNRVTVLRQPKEGADRIETEIHPLQSNGAYTLVKLKLLTGKTHQLRAVLADLGHPVIGDPKYGSEEANRAIRRLMPLRVQLLHAWELDFPELEGRFARLSKRRFQAPLPAAFKKCLSLLDLDIPN